MTNAIGTPVDSQSADPQTYSRLAAYFDAKSAHDLEKTLSFFHPDKLAYYDATLGWAFPSQAALRAGLAEHMPAWPEAAKSYQTRVVGGPQSAFVMLTDTPELFGSELRAIASIAFEDGLIVRWIDYWDARDFGATAADAMRVPESDFPIDLGASTIGDTDDARVHAVGTTLATALGSGDIDGISRLLAPEAVWEDLPLRLALRGPAAILRYFGAALDSLPFGAGMRPARTLGGGAGGGVEWVSDGAVPRGVLVFELNAAGLITRVTGTWDASRLATDRMVHLLELSLS